LNGQSVLLSKNYGHLFGSRPRAREAAFERRLGVAVCPEIKEEASHTWMVSSRIESRAEQR
jgi:hypothetical protein